MCSLNNSDYFDLDFNLDGFDTICENEYETTSVNIKETISNTVIGIKSPHLDSTKNDYVKTEPINKRNETSIMDCDAKKTNGKRLSILNSPVICKSPKVVYERKFPGPAGLIPKKTSVPNDFVMDFANENSINQEDICSQQTHLTFETGPWQQFLHDINAQCATVHTVLDDFSISSIKRIITVSRSRPCKIPLFVAVMYHIDCSVPDPSVILKDPSGEMQGTLHRDIWAKFNAKLTAGSVIFLRNVGILHFRNSRKQYLNITTNNVIAIYPIAQNSKYDIVRVCSYPNNDDIPQLRDRWKSYIHSEITPIPVQDMHAESPNKKYVPQCNNSQITLLNKAPSKNNFNSPLFSNGIYETCNKFCPKKSIFNNNKNGTIRDNFSDTKENVLANDNVTQDEEFIISNIFEGIDADSIFDEF